MDGIINVYKEAGFTSHDVVAKLRGILHQKKIGHTGTLDPAAEGVLPVCLGKGTKLCDMLADRSKTYQAVMLLGQVTDTQDSTGAVLDTKSVAVTEEELTNVIRSFVGSYDQIPPMYSALKVNGKKLYELAREGKTVERKARTVEIKDIRIDKIDLPRVTMTVDCSKGTYIRTLCHDIGQKIGCGACMDYLLRTRVGSFKIEDSLKLSEIEALRDEENLLSRISPVDEAFQDCPAARITEAGEKYLKNGNPLKQEQFELPEGCEGDKIRLYDLDGTFCAVYRFQEEGQLWKPEKMFL